MPADDDDDEEDDEEEAVDMEGKKKLLLGIKNNFILMQRILIIMGLKWAFVCICICYLHGQSFTHKVKKRKLNS